MDCQSLPIGKVYCCISLVHGGMSHPQSRSILSYINKYDVNIHSIEVVDDRIKQWLSHNYNDVVINEIPCFIVSTSHPSTHVFPVTKFIDVIRLADRLDVQ